jgi:hypothetical protein
VKGRVEVYGNPSFAVLIYNSRIGGSASTPGISLKNLPLLLGALKKIPTFS